MFFSHLFLCFYLFSFYHPIGHTYFFFFYSQGILFIIASVQATLTNYHRVGSLDYEHLFPTVLEAGKCTMKVPDNSVSD